MNRKRRTYPNLKTWRDELGLSQEEAAQTLGLTQSVYSRVERQMRAPKPQAAKAISEMSGVPLESILGIS